MTAQAQSFYSDSLYRQAQRWYFLAVQEESYLPRAEAAFHALIRRYGPQSPLQMYLYGLLALKARYAWNPLKKGEYFRQAVASMDALVARSPDDPEVRFLRGTFYYYLPAFLGKREAARQDLAAVANLLQAQPHLYRTRYSAEVLRAILGFLRQSGWIPPDQLQTLESLYSL
ncbi:MAG: hypothetical protein D6750_06565 [Bacteroidetes bacterium]|nr:MAG: hypothetical protein D6750_06565 [Bacteroidota bacterium]